MSKAPDLQSPAPRTEYKTPLIPKIHPKIHPETPPETKIRKKYEKYTKTPDFRIFFVFFRTLVLGGDSGCILGCILGIRGVLYSVRGAGDRNSRSPLFPESLAGSSDIFYFCPLLSEEGGGGSEGRGNFSKIRAKRGKKGGGGGV